MNVPGEMVDISPEELRYITPIVLLIIHYRHYPNRWDKMRWSAEQYKERMETLREMYKVSSFLLSWSSSQSTGHEKPVDVRDRDVEDPHVDLQGAGPNLRGFLRGTGAQEPALLALSLGGGRRWR